MWTRTQFAHLLEPLGVKLHLLSCWFVAHCKQAGVDPGTMVNDVSQHPWAVFWHSASGWWSCHLLLECNGRRSLWVSCLRVVGIVHYDDVRSTLLDLSFLFCVFYVFAVDFFILWMCNKEYYVKRIHTSPLSRFTVCTLPAKLNQATCCQH